MKRSPSTESDYRSRARDLDQTKIIAMQFIYQGNASWIENLYRASYYIIISLVIVTMVMTVIIAVS